jgi:hypothetical protein
MRREDEYKSIRDYADKGEWYEQDDMTTARRLGQIVSTLLALVAACGVVYVLLVLAADAV